MPRRPTGYTLAELLVTVAIAAVMLAIGLPAMGSSVRRARSDTAFNAITTAFAFARSSAVKRHQPVVACPSADGSTCRTDGVWDGGWIVRTDPDNTHDPQPVLRVFEGPGTTLQARTGTGRPLARFLPGGTAHGSNLTLTLCDRSSGQRIGAVVLNNAGRTRTERERHFAPCPFQ